MKRFALFTVITMILFLCLSGLAIAQEKKPDATLTMSEGQVGVGIGYSWGKGILVVEDNQVNQRVVAAILRKKGYSVDIAANGKEALEMLARAMNSLVLMDVQMPVLYGLEATRKLRKDPRWRDLPVIAMTAHAMTGDREKALEAGCDNFDTKPVDWPRLRAKIQALLPGAASG